MCALRPRKPVVRGHSPPRHSDNSVRSFHLLFACATRKRCPCAPGNKPVSVPFLPVFEKGARIWWMSKLRNQDAPVTLLPKHATGCLPPKVLSPPFFPLPHSCAFW